QQDKIFLKSHLKAKQATPRVLKQGHCGAEFRLRHLHQLRTGMRVGVPRSAVAAAVPSKAVAAAVRKVCKSGSLLIYGRLLYTRSQTQSPELRFVRSRQWCEFSRCRPGVRG
ncbi:unnamed protein product, partial [Ectocarpus sp. 12 AP-2014]